MKWKDMTAMEKARFVIACIAAVLVVAAKVKTDLFPIDPTYPCIAVVTVCEALAYWPKKRKWSYLLIAAAVVSLAFFIFELVLLG